MLGWRGNKKQTQGSVDTDTEGAVKELGYQEASQVNTTDAKNKAALLKVDGARKPSVGAGELEKGVLGTPLTSSESSMLATPVGGEFVEYKAKQVDIRQGVAAAVIMHLAFSVGYAVTAFVVSRSPFGGGANAVIVTVVLMVYDALLVMGLHTSFGPTLYGVLLGATMGLAFMSLESAIYWGQASSCGNELDVDDESCSNPQAMKGVCAFSSLLFVTEVLLTVILCAWVEMLCPDYAHSGAQEITRDFDIRRRLRRGGKGLYQAAEHEGEGGEISVSLPTDDTVPQYRPAR